MRENIKIVNSKFLYVTFATTEAVSRSTCQSRGNLMTDSTDNPRHVSMDV